jgi:protein-S-isoprenylcysteine O-methyltransferase Ste14
MLSHDRTGGAFSHIRYPMYLGAWLAYFGFVLSTLSLASLVDPQAPGRT